MTRLLLFFLVIMALYWNACSCKTDASGVVLDAKTLQPLAGVRVQISMSIIHGDTLDKPVVTNSEGHYEFVHFYCENYLLDFSREGYVSHTTDPEQQDTILLFLLEDLEEDY